jgi:predicted CXXCH cytochrome family protein
MAMNSKLILPFLVTCTVVSLFLSSYALAFTIAYPPTGSYVEHEAVNIILEMDQDSLDTVNVTVNTFQYPPIDVPPGVGNFCFGITLATGINTITVDGYKNNNKISELELEIFFRSPLISSSKKASRKYQQYIFHTAENEKDCEACHNLDPGLGDLNPVRPEDSPCYSCHKNKMVSANLHVPSKKWECLQCHEMKKGVQKYSVPKPVEPLCYRCHGKQVTGWKNMKMIHGPTGVGQCTLCHDPHGTDWPALTRMQATDLCVNCHSEKDSGKHVIAGFFGKGHPTRGVPDPINIGKEFSCASCHNPHGSNNAKLLRKDNANMGVFCNACHKK